MDLHDTARAILERVGGRDASLEPELVNWIAEQLEAVYVYGGSCASYMVIQECLKRIDAPDTPKSIAANALRLINPFPE